MTTALRGNLTPGKFRGGQAYLHQVQVLEDSLISWETSQQKYVPWGLMGGADGKPAELSLNPGTDHAEQLPPYGSGKRLKAGDVLSWLGATAGGYGDPLERDPQKVLDDYLDEFISAEEALQDYGVVIDTSLNVVDLEKTKLTRTKRKKTK